MHSGSRTLETADGPMRCYEAVPDDGATAAVVVVQEAFGVNNHIEDVTRRFADGRVPRRRSRLLPPRRRRHRASTATSTR